MANIKAINYSLIGTGDLQVPADIHGRLEHKFDKYISTGAIAIATTISMFRIPVDARIYSTKFSSTDLGTTGTIDIGFFKAEGRDEIGAVVDGDALTPTAIDVNTAAQDNTELVAIGDKGQYAWELAGLSAKPAYGEFLVVMTALTATTAAGTMTLEMDISKE